MVDRMSKYAFIVAANSRYLPGLNAILNSLEVAKNTHDVVVLPYKITERYIDRVDRSPFGFKVHWLPIEEEEVLWLGEGEVLMRKRYEMPSILGYDAVCILDADMMIFRDVSSFFKIAAETEIILGCGLEQKRYYGLKNHQYPAGSGRYLFDPEHWNDRDLACAPLFAGPRWYEALRKSYRICADHPHEERFKAPDMDALNICLLAAGSYDHTVCLSQRNWTGLHETFMKAHSRIVDMHGKPFTEDGEEIYIAHGQFWNKTWRGWQIENQLAMVDREFDKSESYKSRSRGSWEHLIRLYQYYAEKCTINIEDFRQDIMSHKPAENCMELT